MSWTGIKVRHEDGRQGVIKDEGDVVGYRTLVIRVDGVDVDDVVLNVCGKDSGATGWYFLSDDNGREPMWIQPGDHWAPEATR